MSTKKNKALILSFYDLYNKRELDTCYELFAPEYVFHSTIGDCSLEQIKKADAAVIAASPDYICTVNNIIGEGDKVAYQVTTRGTHTGEWMGIPSTGKKVEMTNTYIIRIVANKMVEQWGTVDSLNLLQQLGVVPKQ